MDSLSKTESSPTPAQERPQTPRRKVSSQAKNPTTPPNSYMPFPPGAPRAQIFRRSEQRWTGKDQQSTLSRVQNRLNNRFVGAGARRDASSPKSRSRSPPQDRLISYRSRSPPRLHHRVRKSVEVTFGPLIIKTGSQDPEHGQGMAGNTSMGKDENADVKSPEQELDDFYKVGKTFRYDERDVK
ncbi:hypothetical protein DSL72_004427 [Monilinia vaccinii-corymbosi]|uniref:Uncharacterized protein n=1 Tax=Monilinia vaccinii-corymbosi TaxID=61207 RepID=A0A8A3P8S4_9HELO|nr:hypothetical protein DSL72_004427 [Monilinia vaccinii-corymbosi]